MQRADRKNHRGFDDPHQREWQREFALQGAGAGEKNSEQTSGERYGRSLKAGDQRNGNARQSEPLPHIVFNPLIDAADLDRASEPREPSGNRHHDDSERLHPEAGIGRGPRVRADN